MSDLDPKYFEYEPADPSQEEEFQMWQELEMPPEEVVDPETRAAYAKWLEEHPSDE